MPIVEVPVFTEKEQQEIQQHLAELQKSCLEEIAATPSQREQILQRYKSNASAFVESRRDAKLTKTFHSLVWVEAISGGMIALALILDWEILCAFGVFCFLFAWCNTWLLAHKGYSNPRLHSYVFGPTLLLVGMVLMNPAQRSYSPNSIVPVKTRKNFVTRTELLSGIQMQAAEERRLRSMKKVGIVLILIGGAVALHRVGRDLNVIDEP